jgi:hypothetical protein
MAQNSSDKVPFMTKSLSSDAIKNVDVQTSGGSISVSGVTPAESKVEVYVTANNNKKNLTKEEIQAIIKEKYDLNVSVANNKLTATSKPKAGFKDWKDGLSFSFKVYVPVNVSTELNTSGGSISLNNLSGNLDFATSGGSLNVNNVSGKVTGRTSGGSIHVANAKNDIELTTSGGSIEAENCDGTLKLTTSGGSLNLHNLKGEIKATTSGGSIDGQDIEGELFTHTSGGSIHLDGLSGSLETSTSGGNIDVAILNPGKFVKISNSAGNVNLQLPKNKGLDLDLNASKIKTDNLESFNGKLDDEHIVGKLNGGGVPVTVNAGSGKINLGLK